MSCLKICSKHNAYLFCSKHNTYLYNISLLTLYLFIILRHPSQTKNKIGHNVSNYYIAIKDLGSIIKKVTI